MIRHLQSKKIVTQLENPLDRLLKKFMERHIGQWIRRDRVMYCCGFENPENEPHGAYVGFECSRNRVNQVLKRNGMEIISRSSGKETEVFLGSAEGDSEC
jgi:hypothetical protein